MRILMEVEIQCPILSCQYIQHMVIQMTDLRVVANILCKVSNTGQCIS